MDDVLVVFVEAALRAADPVASAERPDLAELRRLRAAHRAAGTVLHEAKRIEGARTGVFWGAEFGSDFKITGELACRDHLVVLTLACLKAALTWRELNQLVSTWTHH